MASKTLQAHRQLRLWLFSGLLLVLLVFVPSATPRDPEQSTSDPFPIETSKSSGQEGSLRSEAADKWGEITVAQPKIWQYERVNALLDGLLRDVEGVSMADLIKLDPNAQNAAAVRFIQTTMGVAIQYNQAAHVNARTTLETWQAQHDQQVDQLKQYNDYLTSLNAQRSQTASQLFTANNTIATLQGQTDAGGQLSAAQQKQLTDAQNRATALKTQLNDVNNMITAAGPPPTLTQPPAVQGTSAQSAEQPPLTSFTDFMNSLPDGVKKGLTSALQSPSYPASKQLDSFITLLHERLAREISVQQDDLIRDPGNLAFLVQFDVGLYPSSKAKNHQARVEFELTNCPGCKVYSLYPGQSSYNVVNYQGASHRRSFTGNLLTLIGLGITSSYQRQENSLQGSLVQSVYISGFQDDMNSADGSSRTVAQRFGWYYSAAPFDQYVTPGIRSTFALITVPRKLVECFRQTKRDYPDSDCAKIQEEDDPPPPQLKRRDLTRDGQYRIFLKANADWAKRDNPMFQKTGWFLKRYLGKEHRSEVERSLSVELPGTAELSRSPAQFDPTRLHVLRMEYNTVTDKPNATTPAASPSPTPPQPTALTKACLKDECASVLISLDAPIDPNLVVTVHGNLMQRVRDWRGRATSILPPAQSTSDLGPQPTGATQIKTQNPTFRSLMEVDQLQPDSWFAVTSHDLLLNISRGVGGEEEFPVIQLSVPGKETLVIPNDLRENVTEIIADGFRYLPANKIHDHIARDFGNVGTSKHHGNPGLTQKATNGGGTLDTGGNSSPTQGYAQGGPFPYTTFLPLFWPKPAAKNFYAYAGETGEDLIIGFLEGSEGGPTQKRYSFLETRTLAILEDPDLDLAWPLPCENQGNELICHLPKKAISQAYRDVSNVCGLNGASCPSIQSRISHLHSDEEPGKASFISGLQVWVEQYDPSGNNAFWSSEPAKIGLFPISEAFTPHPDINGQRIVYKPWHFFADQTDANNIAIEECNYFVDRAHDAKIRYLTPVDFLKNAQLKDQLVTDLGKNRCGYIVLPTSTLATDQLVLQMFLGNDESWTAAIPTAELGPEFWDVRVDPVRAKQGDASGSFSIDKWKVSARVIRMYCGDKLELDENNTLKGIPGAEIAWKDGGKRLVRTPFDAVCQDTWWEKQQAGQIQLELTIPKSAVPDLPETLNLVRTTTTGVNVTVGSLGNLRSLILPTKLKVEVMGDNQFALRGRNAGAIDAVALQSGGKSHIYQAGSAGDLAVVDVAPPPAAKKNSDTQPSGKSSNQKGQRRTQQVAKAATAPATENDSGNRADGADTRLTPGVYAVLPLIRNGNSYIPLEATDDAGAPLVFTKKKQAEPETQQPNKNPAETIVITKTTNTAETPKKKE